MNTDGDLVRHRARRDEEGRLLAKKLGRALFEGLDGRVFGHHVVADLGLGHRLVALRESGASRYRIAGRLPAWSWDVGLSKDDCLETNYFTRMNQAAVNLLTASRAMSAPRSSLLQSAAFRPSDPTRILRRTETHDDDPLVGHAFGNGSTGSKPKTTGYPAKHAGFALRWSRFCWSRPVARSRARRLQTMSRRSVPSGSCSG